MQVTGMLYGAKLLQFVGFPTSEVLGPSASEEEIRGLIDRNGTIFVNNELVRPSSSPVYGELKAMYEELVAAFAARLKAVQRFDILSAIRQVAIRAFKMSWEALE